MLHQQTKLIKWERLRSIVVESCIYIVTCIKTTIWRIVARNPCVWFCLFSQLSFSLQRSASKPMRTKRKKKKTMEKPDPAIELQIGFILYLNNVEHCIQHNQTRRTEHRSTKQRGSRNYVYVKLAKSIFLSVDCIVVGQRNIHNFFGSFGSFSMIRVRCITDQVKWKKKCPSAKLREINSDYIAL